MMTMKRLLPLAIVAANLALLLTPSAYAVAPPPPYSLWPCGGTGAYACTTPDPNGCYSYGSYSIRDALQLRSGTSFSPRDSQSPDPQFGACSGDLPFCQVGPQLTGVTAELVQEPNGGRDIVFNVPYDFPNNYCQVDADPSNPACGARIWPPQNVLESPPVRLLIVDGATHEILVTAPAVFESGVWKPRLNAGCGGSSKTYRIIASNGGDVFPGCGPNPTAEVDLNVDVPAPDGDCNPDRWCPTCGGASNQTSASGGHPISFGSGDVSLTEGLFSIDQQPLSLHFSITYHSEKPIYPALVYAPMGNGWTHTFNDLVRPVGSSGLFLYRVDGDGHETLFEGRPNGPWFPTSPAELTGRESVAAVNGQYVLTDIDGNVLKYDGASGRWQSTTDRWGNALTSNYDNSGVLTGVTDTEGRTIAFTYGGGGVASVALPTGETWRFQYDGVSLSAVFDPIHTGATPWRTYDYVNDSHLIPRLLAHARDEAGALLEGHTYDGQGRGLTSVAEGGRDSMTVSYGTPGQTHVTTAIDGTTSQQGDYTMRYKGGRWLPTQIVGTCASCGASSDTQSFTIDDDNRVTSRTDGNGHVTQYGYDGAGNVTTRTEAFGTAKQRTTSYLHEDLAWPSFVTRVIEPSAARPGATKVTTSTWNAGETLLTRSESGYLALTDTTPTTYTSTMTFDSRHRSIAADGPRTDVQDVTQSAYFADSDANATRRGRLQRVTDAAGLIRTFDNYDIYGAARQITDPNGVTTTLVTDSRGRVTSTTNNPVAGDPNETAAYTSTSVFDGRDRLTQTTMPRGNRMTYAYEDGTNRTTDTIRLDGSGNEAERRHFTLNIVGDKVTEEDQACAAPGVPCSSWSTKRSESYAYEEHNRLLAIQHPVPAGAKVVYEYDADGKLASVIDENHTTPNTIYSYDQLDRLTSVTQTLASAPGGVAITRYDYDVMDNLVAVTDPNGNITRYAYDDFRRMVRQDSPVTNATTYVYDPAGNLTSTTDARGATTTRVYDALNRILTTTSVLGASSEVVSFAYDDPTAGNYGKGRLSSMTDPSGSTAYAYDRRGLLRSEAKTILGDGYSTRYAYDANGNRSGMTYPSGRQLTYAFDFADRALSLSGTLNAVTTPYIAAASYQPFGPETSLTYGAASLSRNATYDQRYRLTSFNVLAGATPLADYRYGLDAVGNITAITDNLDPRYSRSFGYDDLYRLTAANTGSGLWGNGSYAYDPLGNRLAAALGAKASSYTYVGPTSKLAAVTESGATRNVVYDAAGNEQQVGTSTFVYSPRNYLDQGDGLRYVYDGSGIRVAQVGVTVGPLITQQPQSQPVCPGGSATLAVTATGATTFEWQSFDGTNWNDIPAGTSASVSVTPTSPMQYRVIVSNAAASTTSSTATVTPIAVATEPVSGMLYGDANHDGVVDASDVTLLRSYLTGKQPLPVPSAVIDLNGDGVVDAVDLSLLGAYTTHAIACLPQLPPSAVQAASRLRVVPNQVSLNPTQYFLYTPENSLMSQTELKAGGGQPQIDADYIWFNGHPIAEERTPIPTRYTFTDHLGAPFLQTDTFSTALWRPEYEPFGTVYRMRTGVAAVQRLRSPGQEFDDQTPEREYNVFRWYASGWGRYTQDDPIGLEGGMNGYVYAFDDPVDAFDPFGLDWIEYNGQKVTWYTGPTGDRSQPHRACAATSGGPYNQYPKDQNLPDLGPVPEGWYDVNLSPNPDRLAKADPRTAELLASAVGGIEIIPQQFTTPSGDTFTYPGWGTWRSRLQPKRGRTFGRSNFYFHNSHKGYTHGCVETCDELLNDFKAYRKNHHDIDVLIHYTTRTTNGGTRRP
jgi:RHS repeat-associated protein